MEYIHSPAYIDTQRPVVEYAKYPFLRVVLCVLEKEIIKHGGGQ